jgi:hypothetical protein
LRYGGAVDVEALRSACASHSVDRVFAGDHHNHRRWSLGGVDGRVIQLGALVPTGLDNEGVCGYGTLAIFDTETGATGIEHLPGPRFIRGAMIPDARRAAAAGHVVYVEVRAGDVDSRRDVADMKADGTIADFDVAPDAAEALEPARAAAAEAHRRAADVGVALAEFVARMPLPDGVQAADVLEAALRHVEAGRRASP